MKRINPILVLGICVLVIAGVYGGYLFYTKSAQQSQMNQLEAKKLELENQIITYQAKNLEEAISAKELMDYLDTNRMKWSDVIRNIRETLPKGDNGAYLVDVLSYSGTSDGKISMSVQTVPGSTDPYSSVARLIEIFDNSKIFKDNFVPSIGGGVTPFGKQILTFNLSTMFVPQEVNVDSAGGSDNGVQKKVSR